MFDCTSSDGRVTVVEDYSGFYIQNNATGEVRGIGDGVDMFQSDDGESVWVGTPEFYTLLQEWVSDDTDTLLEAYFGGNE